MKIFIFGSNGMLGTYLTEYLSSRFDVIPITRNEVDLTDDLSIISQRYFFGKEDIIINASGVIKQREYNVEELIKVNSLFPHFLSNLDCNVIHITTDCVYSGKDGSYDEDSFHDCLDDYGKSKSLGESDNLTIIRTSIIGEEFHNKKSLIEWIKSHSNDNINGYINHFWNGLTCLELSKQIEIIIKSNNYWKGVRHYHSPDSVSKYQLVSYINEIYELNNKVVPIMSNYCDRTLSTKYELNINKTIKEQIVELKNFSIFDNIRKFKNFPSFNFINLKDSEERRTKITKEASKCGIKVVPHIFDRYTPEDHIIDVGPIDANEYIYNHSYLGAFTSHLKAIREWYENTNEEYAFFCEDDLSFETVQYWNFNWEQFVDRLPKNWQTVQLALTRENMFTFFEPRVHFRNRCYCDWSCTAYLIKREHAKKILNNYFDGTKFSFEYMGIDKNYRDCEFIKPSIETTIYTTFKENTNYTFPLFVENVNFSSLVWDSKNTYSYDTIMNWWKTEGKDMCLDEIFYFVENK